MKVAMKVLVFPFILAMAAGVVFLLLRGSRKGKPNWGAIHTVIFSSLLFVGLGLIGMYRSVVAPDIQCGSLHQVTTSPPPSPSTAADYFALANYLYDQGQCQRALTNFSITIDLNPGFPQAYNNRAYTYMRLRLYAQALLDLNRALTLRPDYVQALMNRGDIHNYYYQIDRQSAATDYQRVIAQTGPSAANTSVCHDLFLARNNGWNFGTVLGVLSSRFYSCYQ